MGLALWLGAFHALHPTVTAAKRSVSTVEHNASEATSADIERSSPRQRKQNDLFRLIEQKVKRGMTPQQVVRHLGQPDWTRGGAAVSGGEQTFWYYDCVDGVITLRFDSDASFGGRVLDWLPGEW